jgi:hypothetical protein
MIDLRDVVVPAGGQISKSYAAMIGTPCRALAPLGPDRTPVMQVVVDALRASGAVRRIVGVAAEAVADRITGVDLWLPAGDSGPANIWSGLAALESPETPALVCTSDLPRLTADAVREFTAVCEAEADITIGLVRAAAYEEAFLGAPPSQWVWLRDAGPVTLGGLFQIRPALLARNPGRLKSVMDARKSQFRTAHLLGPRCLWAWATKSLTLQALTARGETVLEGRVQVVQDCSPVLAFDIDTEDDYTYSDTRFQNQRDAGAERPHSVRL